MKKTHQSIAFILFNICFIASFAQTNYNVVQGTDNVSITEVSLTHDGSTIVQTSGVGTNTGTNKSVIINYFEIDSAGYSIRLDQFNNEGSIVANNNFGPTVGGVGVYEQGATYLASNPISWQAAMTRSASDVDALSFLYYDGTSNLPSGDDFDVLWSRGLQDDDYLAVGERNGNSSFTIRPLDSNGNVISTARALRFGNVNGSSSPNGNNKYDWDIGYAPSNLTSQSMMYIVVDVELFNANQAVYGYRVDNTSQADLKIFGLSNNSFADNPVNPMVSSISGEVVNDANGYVNNKIDGTGIGSINSNSLYLSVVDSITNQVAYTMAVPSSGIFNFPAITDGTYHLILTTSAQTVGSNLTSASNIPLTEYIGEGLDSANRDGSNDGQIRNISLNNSQQPMVRFGLNRLPDTDNRSLSISKPKYFNFMDITGSGILPLAGSDFEDDSIGDGQDFAITSLPTNGNQIWYNGSRIQYGDDGINPPSTSNPFYINNYSPVLLQMRFTGFGSTSTSFNYASIDEAGAMDETPATYSMTWSGALPVDLVDFKAVKDGSNVLLNWTTASEHNSSHFEIQRLQAEHISNIGRVYANGNSMDLIEYEFTDFNPLEANSAYRLKMVDHDGQVEYSDWKHIEANSISFNIYPNPASEYLEIQNSSLEGTTLTIINMNGAVVQEIEFTSNLHLELTHIPNGLYIFNTSNRYSQESHKVRIVH